MNINEMHYEVKLRFNKLDSQYLQDLAPAQIDRVLNEAIRNFVEYGYSGRSAAGLDFGFEALQRNTDMLSSLVVKNPEQVPLAPINFDATLNVYEVPFANLTFEYVHFLRAFINTDCAGDINVTSAQLVQQDDLNIVLVDVFRKPSLKWRRLIASIGKSKNQLGQSSLYLYTNGEFAVTNVYIEYLKAPKVVYFGGYDSLDNLYTTGDPQVDCDLPVFYHGAIIDFAVQNLFRTLISQQGVVINQKPTD